MLIYYMSLGDSPGEKRKVEEIYHQYKKLIKYIALTKLQNEHLAEDAVHDVMLAVIGNITKLQERSMEEIRGFIYLVTRNICNDLLRKEQRRAAENIEDLRQQPHSGGDPQQALNEKSILDCIARMPDLYRDALELTVYYGFTTKECAKLLKISPAACRKRLERARTLIREELKKGEEHHV